LQAILIFLNNLSWKYRKNLNVLRVKVKYGGGGKRRRRRCREVSEVYSIVLENILKILRYLKFNINYYNDELYKIKYDNVNYNNKNIDICIIKLYTYQDKHQNDLYNEIIFINNINDNHELDYIIKYILHKKYFNYNISEKLAGRTIFIFTNKNLFNNNYDYNIIKIKYKNTLNYFIVIDCVDNNLAVATTLNYILNYMFKRLNAFYSSLENSYKNSINTWRLFKNIVRLKYKTKSFNRLINLINRKQYNVEKMYENKQISNITLNAFIFFCEFCIKLISTIIRYLNNYVKIKITNMVYSIMKNYMNTDSMLEIVDKLKQKIIKILDKKEDKIIHNLLNAEVIKH